MLTSNPTKDKKSAYAEPTLVRAAQAQTLSLMTPGGVQGLPRCSPHSAGALALWHTANPNPYEAAFWSAEFAALHDAFVALRRGAETWDAPSADTGGWRVASFACAHPQVREKTLRKARECQAERLKAFLPQPFAALAAPATHRS